MEQIVGVGMDLIERSRVAASCQKESFLKKYFSPEERLEIEERPSRAATDFAGKEAVAKALGTGFSGICPIEIEVLRRENGAPYVKLGGGAKELAKKLGVTNVHISLSDTDELAGAYAVCVGTADQNKERAEKRCAI